MMRIAFFTDTYHPTKDGVVRAIDNFKKGLERKGHEVKIFAPSPENEKDKKNEVIYAPSVQFPTYPQYRIPIFRENILKECIEFKPQIIHSHAMVLMALSAKKAAKKLNVPLVGSFHTFLPYAGHYLTTNQGLNEWFKKLSWDYLKWLYKDFDLVLSPSYFCKEVVSKNEIKSELVVPSPIDMDLFKKQKSQRQKKEYILYFGRVAKEKNLDLVIEIARLKSFEQLNLPLVIAGDGPYREHLIKKVQENKLNIRFIEKVEDKDIPQLYARAYLTINLSEFETQGLSAIESLAAGVPVLCIKNTALEELIQNKAGIAEYKEPNLLVLGIKSIFERYGYFSKNAKRQAKKYSIEDCTKKLLKAYEVALKRKANKTKQV